MGRVVLSRKRDNALWYLPVATERRNARWCWWTQIFSTVPFAMNHWQFPSSRFCFREFLTINLSEVDNESIVLNDQCFIFKPPVLCSLSEREATKLFGKTLLMLLRVKEFTGSFHFGFIYCYYVWFLRWMTLNLISFVFCLLQCDNGHLACSSCCPKLSNHCPSCASPIGDKRCRAMENVLESTFVPCQNAELGCTKNVSYGKESTHKRECNFSPCSCPVQDCNFIGTYKDLYVHYRITHSKNYLLDRFTCGVSFSTQLNIKNETVILRENSKYLLFTMHCFRKPYGVIVTISCIAPSAPEVGEFSYHLSYTVDGHTLTYESSKVKRVLEVSCQTGQENFMLIPHCLLRGDLLKMELCIRSRRSITEQEG